MELLGIPCDVKAEILKLASISLCPSTIGQISVGLTARPPKPGEESYELYVTEKTQILRSLQRRADSLSAALNKINGITCNPIDGAMYAFPNITLPSKLVSAAEAEGVAPDAFYCMELLERTGIVVVPGSGFGQRDGTYHFRTTILPPEDKMKKVGAAFAKFHTEFTAEYA